MAMAAGATSLPHSSFCSTKSSITFKPNKRRRIVCKFNHFAEVVTKDMEFLKKGFSWASETLHIPQISKSVDHFVWLRHLENPQSSFLQPQSLPKPFYSGLTGVDLLMADLKALEAYVNYIYHLSKMWSKPLPETYDPQEVEDYFNCRPHVVTFRFIEVFSSFAVAAIKMRASKFKLNKLGVDENGNNKEYYFGKLLKETMLNLGPTFIKVGQSLSTRPDIIGPEISKALCELHDQIPPFPRNVAMQIIEEELGAPVDKVFNYISEEPVAAASFGQVYRGSTFDGNNVAIKVQRPDLRHVVVRDIYILRLGLGILQKVAKRTNDLRLYADELGKGLVGELDYTLEAKNASEFQEAHSPFKFIFVPKIYRHLTRKRVLTMEWVVGENPNDLIALSTRSLISDGGSQYSENQQVEAKKRLLDMVNKGVEASLVQLLETGILHADPHPGNLRYTATGKIGFLDFGLICRMEKKHQFAMLGSIIHIVNGDWAALVDDLTEMDVVKPGTNIRLMTMDLENSLGEVEFTDGIPDIKFSRVLGKIWSTALKYHCRMPPYFTLLLRSLASLEGFAVAADQDFKTFESAYPYVAQKLLTDNSASSRKLLHSVVLNKRKEFQWKRLQLFLRVGATRNGLQRATSSKSDASNGSSSNGRNGLVDLANLILRLLPSKDGAVLRRLLVAADGPSLVRAMVSKEALFFRQEISKGLADLIYQWMSGALGQDNTINAYNSRTRMASGPQNRGPGLCSGVPVSIDDYQSLLRDRRLKLIFSKILESTRREQPLLMIKFGWVSLTMFLTASALACHRVLVSWSEMYFAPLSFSPSRQYAVSV